MMIDYGARGRIGLMLPSANRAAEPQFRAMLPAGITVHTTRLKLTNSDESALKAMAATVEDAAELVADAGVDLIAFHCTAVTTYDLDLERSIRERAERASGKPVVTTSEALLSALRALQARRIVMLSPYVEAVDRREVAFFRAHGYEVLAAAGLGKRDAEAMMAVTPDEWLAFARAHRHDEADAYLVSCTTVRALDAVVEMERDLERPVITSNSATAWHCLRRLGVHDPCPGFGRLLHDH